MLHLIPELTVVTGITKEMFLFGKRVLPGMRSLGFGLIMVTAPLRTVSLNMVAVTRLKVTKVFRRATAGVPSLTT